MWKTWPKGLVRQILSHGMGDHDQIRALAWTEFFASLLCKNIYFIVLNLIFFAHFMAAGGLHSNYGLVAKNNK